MINRVQQVVNLEKITVDGVGIPSCYYISIAEVCPSLFEVYEYPSRLHQQLNVKEDCCQQTGDFSARVIKKKSEKGSLIV